MRLLERADTLEMLAEAVDQARAGRGSVMLIAGEAGIGKTSLVRALRDSLGRGSSFLAGACEPLSVPVPLAPLEELRLAAGDGQPPLPTGGDAMALGRALLDTLSSCAPAVAVVEDAHWADPLTLDVLRVVVRRIEVTGTLLVVTYRDDEVAANPPLERLLGDIATSPAVQRLRLSPLSEHAVEQLAAGTGLDAGRLRDATDGNPFLIVETIAAGGAMPASVRDAALARAGRLSSAARRLVDAAAVLGQRFDQSLLRALANDATGAIDEALAHGVLVADGHVVGFRHELIRNAIEQCISPTRRADLHAQACDLLAAHPAKADNAVLAHHAELGGLEARAASYASLASGEAERVGALRETYLQAERALRLGHELSEAQRLELLLRYARASNFVNPDLAQGEDAARRAVELAETLGDERGRGNALMALAYTLWSLERVVEARAAAADAVAAFTPSGDAASLAWAYATLIRIDATSFDPAAAIETARAVGLDRPSERDEIAVDVAISVGLAKGHLGDPEAIRILEAALQAAKDGEFSIRVVRGYVNLATVGVALRDHHCVDRTAVEALPLLGELGVSRMPLMSIRLSRARSLVDRGHWDDALPTLSAREPWWLADSALAGTLEGLIRERRGQHDGGAMVSRGWAELNHTAPTETARHGAARLAVVEAAWLRGDLAAARAVLGDAAASAGVARFARTGGELALWAARLGIDLEVPSGAPAPVLLELEGDWRRAASAWLELQAPYEAALAALRGDDRAARHAMATLQQLGALGTARAFARDRTATGGRSARGPRRSTLAHPAGLTRREQEVLEALAGGASNAQIAAQLHLSARTVAHHVSAILAKLGAPTRHDAIEQARTRSLLPDRER